MGGLYWRGWDPTWSDLPVGPSRSAVHHFYSVRNEYLRFACWSVDSFVMKTKKKLESDVCHPKPLLQLPEQIIYRELTVQISSTESTSSSSSSFSLHNNLITCCQYLQDSTRSVDCRSWYTVSQRQRRWAVFHTFPIIHFFLVYPLHINQFPFPFHFISSF